MTHIVDCSPSILSEFGFRLTCDCVFVSLSVCWLTTSQVQTQWRRIRMLMGIQLPSPTHPADNPAGGDSMATDDHSERTSASKPGGAHHKPGRQLKSVSIVVPSVLGAAASSASSVKGTIQIVDMFPTDFPMPVASPAASAHSLSSANLSANSSASASSFSQFSAASSVLATEPLGKRKTRANSMGTLTSCVSEGGHWLSNMRA